MRWRLTRRSQRIALTAWMVFLTAGEARAAAGSDGPRDVPEEAQREIQRRGAMVERIGPAAEVHAGGHLVDALAPPPDDSHKWFLTLVVARDCPACEQMRADFKRSPALAAWVCPQEAHRSWAHWQVIQADDASQAWRWQEVPLSRFPAVILQPPINRVFGDPHAVVYLHQGYLPPEELSDGIRRAIRRYVGKLASAPAARGTASHPPAPPHRAGAAPLTSLPAGNSPPQGPAPLPARGPLSANVPVPAGMPRAAAHGQAGPSASPHERAAAADASSQGDQPSLGQGPGDWKPPVAPPPRLEPPRLVPNLPPEPASGLAVLLVQLLTALVSGQGTGNLLLLAILLWQVWRHLAKARGIPLLVDDALASQLIQALRSAAPANATPASTAPPPVPDGSARS